jgi:hypothetical protein
LQNAGRAVQQSCHVERSRDISARITG